MTRGRPRSTHRTAIGALVAFLLATGTPQAGGLLLYEFGTAEPGLAAAGYAARAEDASTAFTNPAGMTRLEGTQLLVGGQVMWLNTEFSIGEDTSPGLGDGGGGRALGSNGFVPGGGAFVTHRLSPDVSMGFSIAGNFGSMVEYDDGWVGRYRAQQATLLGVQLVPSIAYRVSDKLSVGAGLNVVYGIFDQKVAINNVVPGAADGRLELDDEAWGLGGNVGLLYEAAPGTRLGLTWTSQVDLDFVATPRFSGLGPALSALLASRGLLDARVELGTKIPQQVMGSVAARIDGRWTLLGNVGWQQWSAFGEPEIGIDNTQDPTSLTASIPFKDTWHVAVGAQHRLSDPWTLHLGLAYDADFQEQGSVTPLLPVNATWRLGVGGEQQLSTSARWGIAGALLFGGTLDIDKRSTLPPVLGGRGDLVGSYEDTASIVVSAYGSWTF